MGHTRKARRSLRGIPHSDAAPRFPLSPEQVRAMPIDQLYEHISDTDDTDASSEEVDSRG